jgi:hypothetical protein
MIKKLLHSLLLLLAVVPFPSARACHHSSIVVDSVVPAGINYTIYITLCVGAGRNGLSTGAEQSTGIFAFGFWSSSVSPSFLISDVSPDTVISALYPGTGPYYTPGAACPPGVNPLNLDCQVSFAPVVPGSWYACVNSISLCGDTATYCQQFSFTANVCPDSIVALGIEGANIATNGCYTGTGSYPYEMVVAYPCSVTTLVEDEEESWNEIYYSQSEGTLFIELNSKDLGEYQLDIFSLTGSRMQGQSFSKNQVWMKHEVRTGYLPAGVYFISLQGGGKKTSKKWLVM